MPDPAAIGRAGEYRVVSELLLRGHHPLLATVDNGVDVILAGSGRTIQVKASVSTQQQRDRAHHLFSFSAQPRRRDTPRVARLIADFAICWCVPIDAFYVIPAEVIGTRTSICIPQTPTRPSRYSPFLNQWGVLTS